MIIHKMATRCREIAFSMINRRQMGYGLGWKSKTGGGYIDAASTISAARAQGLSVCDYVESMWDQRGCTDAVVREMQQAGSLARGDRFCEIGPGTGRYLERVLQKTAPEQYDIYETDDDWATWLARTYAPPVVRQPADGHTLRPTPDRSCALVHAHGVFVYLPFLHAFEYFAEMCRVCAVGGHVVFDFYSDEDFTPDVIERWLKSSEHYPVILPHKTVLRFFEGRSFMVAHEFDNKYGRSYSHYVVLRRTP